MPFLPAILVRMDLVRWKNPTLNGCELRLPLSTLGARRRLPSRRLHVRSLLHQRFSFSCARLHVCVMFVSEGEQARRYVQERANMGMDASFSYHLA